MCTKIQDFAFKIRKFSGGHTPGPPRREGATDRPAPTRSMAAPCAGARSAPPPGSADPDPHSYFNTPKFKILYNTLVCKHLISLDCHEGDIHSRIFKFNGQINVQFHTSWS
jgi:hypothetical protein